MTHLYSALELVLWTWVEQLWLSVCCPIQPLYFMVKRSGVSRLQDFITLLQTLQLNGFFALGIYFICNKTEWHCYLRMPRCSELVVSRFLCVLRTVNAVVEAGSLKIDRLRRYEHQWEICSLTVQDPYFFSQLSCVTLHCYFAARVAGISMTNESTGSGVWYLSDKIMTLCYSTRHC